MNIAKTLLKISKIITSYMTAIEFAPAIEGVLEQLGYDDTGERVKYPNALGVSYDLKREAPLPKMLDLTFSTAYQYIDIVSLFYVNAKGAKEVPNTPGFKAEFANLKNLEREINKRLGEDLRFRNVKFEILDKPDIYPEDQFLIEQQEDIKEEEIGVAEVGPKTGEESGEFLSYPKFEEEEYIVKLILQYSIPGFN